MKVEVWNKNGAMFKIVLLILLSKENKYLKKIKFQLSYLTQLLEFTKKKSL